MNSGTDFNEVSRKIFMKFYFSFTAQKKLKLILPLNQDGKVDLQCPENSV